MKLSGKLELAVLTNRQTASYTLVSSDEYKLVEMNVATANTLTIPAHSGVPYRVGTIIDIAQYGAGQTTITPDTGVILRAAGGALKIGEQYGIATAIKIGNNEWYVTGNLVT